MPTRNEINDRIDIEVRNRTVPYSIDNIDVANILRDILDFADALNTGLEEMTILVDSTFEMEAKTKLNSISFKNNSGTDMLLALSYTVGVSTYLLPNITVTVASTVDLDLGIFFWIGGIVTVAGVTGSITMLIDRK